MANLKGDIVSANRHYFNRCVDIDEKTGKKTFETYSLWNRARDCELNDGKNVQETLDDVNNKFKETLIYNPDTDSYQGYINGKWKDVVFAGLKSDGYLVKDGIINNNINLGGGLIRTSFGIINDTIYSPTGKNKLNYQRTPPLIIQNYENKNKLGIIIKFYSVGDTRGIISTQYPIDITKYNNLLITYSADLKGSNLELHSNTYNISTIPFATEEPLPSFSDKSDVSIYLTEYLGDQNFDEYIATAKDYGFKTDNVFDDSDYDDGFEHKNNVNGGMIRLISINDNSEEKTAIFNLKNFSGKYYLIINTISQNFTYSPKFYIKDIRFY